MNFDKYKKFRLLCLVFLDEVYGWIISLRFASWSCFKILYVNRLILNFIQYLTGSQCGLSFFQLWGDAETSDNLAE